MSNKDRGNYQVFRCEVDMYRNGTVFRSGNARLRDRRTKGVYYARAKSRRHAMILVQKAIGFGQVCIPVRQCLPDGLPEIRKNGIVKYDPATDSYTDRIARATDPVPEGGCTDA